MSLIVNMLPPSLVWTRSRSGIIDIIEEDYEFKILIPAGGTVLRSFSIGQVDFATNPWRSTRNVTGTASTHTRPGTIVKIGNDKSDGVVTRHTIPLVRGGWFIRVRANWDSAAMLAKSLTGYVFSVRVLKFDSNNEFRLQYTTGTGWLLRARSGGSNKDITLNIPVVVDREYDLWVRYTSHDVKEHGRDRKLTFVVLRSDTQEVLATGETDYVAPVLVAGKDVGILCDPDVADTQFDGYLVEDRVYPIPPSDEDIGL